jgi:hypothetical protein
MVARWLIGLLFLIATSSVSYAGWSVSVEEAAFGKTEARAVSGTRGASEMFFECVDGEFGFGLIILSKNDEEKSGRAVLKLDEEFEVNIVRPLVAS